jgi:hypothetical protein
LGSDGAIDSAALLKYISTFRRWCLGCRPDAEGVVADVDLAKKAIADGRNSGDVARLAGVISKQASEKGNAAGERIFRDRTIVPHGIQKLIFCDQPVWISKQEEQDSKSLRLYRQHFSSLDDAELALPNLHISEGENKRLVRNHEFITPDSGNDHEPIMTMQSHGHRVLPANSAEEKLRCLPSNGSLP